MNDRSLSFQTKTIRFLGCSEKTTQGTIRRDTKTATRIKAIIDAAHNSAKARPLHEIHDAQISVTPPPHVLTPGLAGRRLVVVTPSIENTKDASWAPGTHGDGEKAASVTRTQEEDADDDDGGTTFAEAWAEEAPRARTTAVATVVAAAAPPK